MKYTEVNEGKVLQVHVWLFPGHFLPLCRTFEDGHNIIRFNRENLTQKSLSHGL